MRLTSAFGLGAVGALLLGTASVSAEEIMFKAMLTGAEEVPAVTTEASGEVDAVLDSETLEFTWTVTYEGLSGDASAAHFHGPAPEGENAPPVVPVEGELASPIEGSATLTDEQVTQLQSGLWYFNVHTAENPGGEIRGQVILQRP